MALMSGSTLEASQALKSRWKGPKEGTNCPPRQAKSKSPHLKKDTKKHFFKVLLFFCSFWLTQTNGCSSRTSVLFWLQGSKTRGRQWKLLLSCKSHPSLRILGILLLRICFSLGGQSHLGEPRRPSRVLLSDWSAHESERLDAFWQRN